MIRGLSIATTGLMANQALSEVVADNIANARTTGYKEEKSTGQAFPNMLLARTDSLVANKDSQIIGTIGTGVSVSPVVRNLINGSLESTGKNTDLALASNGFFTVQTPEGIRYTRNGSFQLSPAGDLTTSEGYPVIGQKGPIGSLSPDFQVKQDGTIMDKGRVVDALEIVQAPADQALQADGQNLYTFSQNPAVTGMVDIRQGMIEDSNVDISQQMGNMISIMRAYEANQKVVQTEDASLDKAVNDVGKV